MMILRLDQLMTAQMGRIFRIIEPGTVRQRMLEMGLVPGADIKKIRVAPLGDPIEYRIKGYHLSLRGSEARNILIEVNCLTLDQILPGQQGTLVGVDSGKQVAKQLSYLGMQIGSLIRVIGNRSRGTVLVQVNGSTIAIGHGLAKKMVIEADPGGNPV